MRGIVIELRIMNKNKFITRLVTALFFLSVYQGMNAQYFTQASAGSIVIHGDIEPVRDALNYFSFGISREMQYNFLVEAKVGFGKAYGLNPELAQTSTVGGYLVERAYDVLGTNSWYPAYSNSHFMFDVGANYRPDIGIEKVRVLAGIGLGVSRSSRRLNLLGFDDRPYDRDFSNMATKERIEAIKNYYDATYETQFKEGSDITPHLSLQLGVQLKLNESLFLHAEWRHHITTSDYLDVVKFSGPTTETGNNDSVSMISVGFSGFLGRRVDNLSAN